MKGLRFLLVVGVLAVLVAPEIPRYVAERRVGFATAAFRSLVERTSDPSARENLLRVGQLALSTTDRLPGDPRPWTLGGSAFLVNGQAERALESYREAFATGERAEIDLNLGRAYALTRRKESSDAAFLRAGWVNPEILASLPSTLAGPLQGQVQDLSRDLVAGRLTAPPPLPDEERR